MSESSIKPTKDCPFCGETILAVARKCKHCGEFLDSSAAADSIAEGHPDYKPPPPTDYKPSPPTDYKPPPPTDYKPPPPTDYKPPPPAQPTYVVAPRFGAAWTNGQIALVISAVVVFLLVGAALWGISQAEDEADRQQEQLDRSMERWGDAYVDCVLDPNCTP